MKKELIDVQKFCENKDICLLGNASSILKAENDIDSYEIVCRMNKGTPFGREKYIGSRTDVLFLSTRLDGERIHQMFYPQFVVWMTVDNNLASPWVMKNAIQNPEGDWQELFNMLSQKPTTGLMALNFLLKHIKFRSLILYGFDFFVTPTWYNAMKGCHKAHDINREKVLIENIVEQNQAVSMA